MHWFLLTLPLAVSAATFQEKAAKADFVKYEELKPQFKTGARRTVSKFGCTLVLDVDLKKILT